MIKINFLTELSRQKKGEYDDPSLIGNIDMPDPLSDSDVRKMALKNLLIILTPVIALYFYENNNIDDLTSQYALLSDKVSSMEQTLNDLNLKKSEIDLLKNKIQKYQKEISEFEKILKRKSLIFNVLNTIQKYLPPNTWIVQFDYNQGSFVLSFHSKEGSDIDLVLELLTNSKLFAKVDLVRAQEIQDNRRGRIVRFDINCVELD